ncbi:MAG: hypothetical protein WD080_12015 [Egibacteraceae bacterium]
MRRPLLALVLAALVLAACVDDDGALPDDRGPSPDGADIGEVEAVAPGEIGPRTNLFGVGFEGLWRFAQATEVALVLEPDAAAADLADELRAQAGVAAVDRLDAAAAEDRAALDALLPPDAPVPPVLLVTADDHPTALSLGALVQREEVAHTLVPTCDALAGTARLHGRARAQALLDAAGCRQIVLVAANADVDTPWVAAAGVDAGTVCIAAAVQHGPLPTSSSTCSRNPADPGLPVAALTGGFVVGFAPANAATVELEAGGRSATVRPVTLADGPALAYAAFLPEPDPDDGPLLGAPDLADLTWRFLDADGAVIDQESGA